MTQKGWQSNQRTSSWSCNFIGIMHTERQYLEIFTPLLWFKQPSLFQWLENSRYWDLTWVQGQLKVQKKITINVDNHFSITLLISVKKEDGQSKGPWTRWRDSKIHVAIKNHGCMVLIRMLHRHFWIESSKLTGKGELSWPEEGPSKMV